MSRGHVKGGHRICEICGIKERNVTGALFYASFPTEENRCKEWLRIVGKEELVQLPIEKLHQLKNVCGNHFKKEDFCNKGNRLKRTAVPQLNLMRDPLSAEQLADFPLHMWNFKQGVLSEVMPSTSQELCMPSTSKQQVMQLVNPQQHEPTTSQQQNLTRQQRKPLTSIQQPIVEEVNTRNDLLTQSSRNMESLEKRGKKRRAEENLELTPREKKLVQQLKKTKCTLKSLKESAILIENIESPALRELILNLVRNKRKKPRGRRWTTKHKISALSIYKRSPKTYRHLLKIGKGAFPSEKTLRNLLNKIPMHPGINKAALNYLRQIAPKTKIKNKQCCLCFDEMAIKPRIIYNVGNDTVEGFEDFGEEFVRTGELADHALVFMLQGLRHKYKQPIAFFFVKGTISSQKLASIIKNIIKEVTGCGFNVINTVCDQGPTNMGALKILRDMSRATEINNYFMIDGKKVFIIYDVPHLLKSIRNNFLKNGIVTLNKKKAQWSHLIKAEEKNRNFLYFKNLTPLHIDPKYRSKMKVKYAAQILSNTVSAIIKMMAREKENESIAVELLETADVVKEFDTLFDLTNGPSSSKDVKIGPSGQRINCSANSNHIEMWNECIKKLQTISFGEAKNVKCISGYITTIQSLKDIWIVLKDMGFKYFNLRQVNQDALENLFGVIRQHSPTNKNPTCSHFMSAIKTSVVTNLTAHHSRGSNCEEDDNELLTNFHHIIFNDQENKENVPVDTKFPIETIDETVEHIPEISIPEEEDLEIEYNLIDMKSQPVVYVSGYLAYKILKFHNCQNCKKNLTVDVPDPNIHMYIILKEWWPEKKSLTYPAISLTNLIQKATKITEEELCQKLHEKNICQLAITMYTAFCDTTWFTCEDHKEVIFNRLFKNLGSLLIRRQCQRVNQSLALREEALASTQKKAQQTGTAK